MRIVVHGHPALRTPSAPVEEITPEIRDFAKELLRSLLESEVPGVGLAAPQIGVDIRMIALMTVDEKRRSRPGALPGELVLESQMPLVLVNPEIVDASAETCTAEEGCLSLPGVAGHVTRPATVTLHARMLDGQEITAECGGLLARCLQHEIDHLDGKLFYDRLSPEEQKKADPQMKKLSKQEAAIRRLLGEEGRK
ncbi:MAG: peptide deformylase [Oligosphaeraceae bacterium]